MSVQQVCSPTHIILGPRNVVGADANRGNLRGFSDTGHVRSTTVDAPIRISRSFLSGQPMEHEEHLFRNGKI
jgi:hypothetical protein